jgi:hypothetical protein
MSESSRYAADKTGPLGPPPIHPGPPPADGQRFLEWQGQAVNFLALSATRQAAGDMQEMLARYTHQIITAADGRQFGVLAENVGAAPSTLPSLPFTVSAGGTEPNHITVWPGVVSGPSVTAGVGNGSGEYFPRISGTPLPDSPVMTVAQGSAWRYVIMTLDTDPVANETDGEYILIGLNLTAATISMVSSLPTDTRVAEVDPVTGNTTPGKAVKTLALVRYHTTDPEADPSLQIIQISVGNWYLQTCEGDLVIFEPNYVAQILNVTEAA